MRGPLNSLRRWGERRAEGKRRAAFHRSLRPLGDAPWQEVPEGEVLLVSVIRNAAGQLDPFLDHYRAMGVRHFAFLDAGSTDGTVERLLQEKDVRLDQSELAMKGYFDLMRAYPLDTYGQNRWCLQMDVDEYLDFEGRQSRGIGALLDYLTGQGATALMSQTIHMFAKDMAPDDAPRDMREVLERFVYFDPTGVEKWALGDPANPLAQALGFNEAFDPELELYFGGLWQRAFGQPLCLSRHPLVFNGPAVNPVAHPNMASGVRVSDVVALLKSYRLANPALSRAVKEPLFSLDARRWNRVELLARAGYLSVPDAYRAELAAGAA